MYKAVVQRLTVKSTLILNNLMLAVYDYLFNIISYTWILTRATPDCHLLVSSVNGRRCKRPRIPT